MTKPTPDEVLAKWDSAANDCAWDANELYDKARELAEASRKAIQQRDLLLNYQNELLKALDQIAALEKERDIWKARAERQGDRIETGWAEYEQACKERDTLQIRNGWLETNNNELRQERDEARNLYAAQSELLAKAFQERDCYRAALNRIKGIIARADEGDELCVWLGDIAEVLNSVCRHPVTVGHQCRDCGEEMPHGPD